MRKWAEEEVRGGKQGEKINKVADRVLSFALIGLHRRKWFTALLSQFTPAAPDLRQTLLYTFTPESWPLPPIVPSWRHFYIHEWNSFLNSSLINCQVFLATTFSQALQGLLGGFGCGAVSIFWCRKWVWTTLDHTGAVSGSALPPWQTLTPHW